eukprot:6189854-Pleurochrysis_carterae.AAC.1
MAGEAMRRWKKALDMGDLRRGRRASCPWRMDNELLLQAVHLATQVLCLDHVFARTEVHSPNLPQDSVVARRGFRRNFLSASWAHRGKH